MGNEPEKTIVTAEEAPASPLEGPLIAEEAGTRRPDRDVAAAVWAIVCGVALPCIPVIVVSAVLLYFIFHYQIVTEPGWPELELNATQAHTHMNALERFSDIRHHGGSPSYYVHYNPSTITTIASWTGRVIPYLSSSIMALVAFFAARRIVTKSMRDDGSNLPSPEQLTLLISLLGGNSLGPLKDTLLHRWARKERLIDPIPFAFFALLVVTFLGILIPIVDTWFGISTTPAIITQLYNDTSAIHTFGRRLSSTMCSQGAGSFSGLGGLEWMPCNLYYYDQDPYGIFPFLHNSQEASLLAQGLSSQNTVSNYSASSGTVYYYLSDPDVSSKLDFKAETLAISAQCKPMTTRCLPGNQWPSLSENSEALNFTCSPGFFANFNFNGEVQTEDASPADSSAGADQSPNIPLVGIGFSPDAKFSKRIGVYDANLTYETVALEGGNGVIAADSPYLGTNWSYQYVYPQNPLNFAVWASGFPTFDASTIAYNTNTNRLLNDSEIYQGSTFTYWILGCSAEVYNVTYTWVNGSIHTFEPTPASADLGGMISGPFAFQLGQAAVALTGIAALAGTQNTSTDLANVFAAGWSKAALALSIGGLENAPNQIEQIRNSTISVARVPMVPLYLLLGLKSLYVVAVIVLAIGPYCFTHPAETEVVKAQLSAKGLAAAHFDSPGLVQKNVVQEIQSRLGKSKTTDDIPDVLREGAPPGEGQLKHAATEPIVKQSAGALPDRRVGLVAQADGAWKFAVVANGVWNSIKPIAVSMVDLEAKNGALGGVGDVVNAWAK